MSESLEIPAGVIETISTALETQDRIEHLIADSKVSLSYVFEQANTDPMVSRLKLLGLLDSFPNRRKIDNRRFLEQAGIVESVKLFELDSENISVLKGEFGE